MLSKNLLIGHRIILGFLVPLTALIVIGAASLRNLETMQREASWVTHTLEIMAEVGRFTDALSRLESAGRGYVITKDAGLKQDLETQQRRASLSLERLRSLTLDNPNQQARIDRAVGLMDRRLELARELVKLRETTEAFDMAQVRATVQSGQDVSDGIRALTYEMNGEESKLLIARQTASQAATERTRRTVVFGSLVAILVVAAGGFLLNRSITGPLAALGSSASRIGQGDYEHRATVVREDEIGHLGEAFNAMAAQVQERQAALAEQDWLKGGLAKFGGMFQRQRDPSAVCQALLQEFATMLGVHRSAIYRAIPGQRALALCASYAAENPPARIAPGEGLVGQSLVGKERILITEAPPHYLRIGSALGHAEPAAVLVEPALFEGQVMAVLELASFQLFTGLQLEFIRQVAESLGIVLQTIESVTRTEELLRESQALTAKLAEQQGALAEKNIELERQAEHLRKSEMLLQEQQVELTQTNEELEQTNEELQQSNEEMEEKSNLLADQKRSLETFNREIEQARTDLQEQARQLTLTSKYKSDFLATMSHELRTPLNSLLILARLLRENRDDNLTAKQVQFAQTIESAGIDLLEMINQILDLAKIESGKVELHLDDLTPTDLQRSVEEQFRHMAEAKKLAFGVNLAPGLPAVLRTDVHRLQQVLKNLLSNAFKFTEAGAVTVDVRVVKNGWKRKVPSLDTAPAVLAIAVTDTGIGISAEKQHLVFESFQQADAGTARRFGGTGLGLSISREVATLLGGTLELESTPGKGSTFTLFLPTSLDPAAAAAGAGSARLASARRPVAPPSSPAPVADAARSSESIAPFAAGGVGDDRDAITPSDRVILIIEDDPKFARILVDFVREKRFKALVASSARQGLALAQHFVPAAITLDLSLTEEDGWTVLDRLKHDERTRHVPVHVITADSSRNRGLRLGAVSFLQKPVTKEAINEILQQTMDFIDRPVKSLLVIEDDPIQRQAISELIGNGDVKTTVAGSAREALERLEHQKFDCIVLDLMLPDMPGVELIRQINQRHGLHAPPVIVYTGKELSPREETELRSLSESIIVKDARSPERLLDETALFLHRVQAKMPEAKRRMLEQVRKQDAVLTGRRVLVVDDDVRNIFALTAALEGFGMVVTFAESGQGAIDMLATGPAFDVVLMDVMMPGMDGNEAIRRLRTDARFARMPIISVTAKAMKGDRERCIEAGASDYITKPVDIEKLLSLLRVWLYR